MHFELCPGHNSEITRGVLLLCVQNLLRERHPVQLLLFFLLFFFCQTNKMSILTSSLGVSFLIELKKCVSVKQFLWYQPTTMSYARTLIQDFVVIFFIHSTKHIPYTGILWQDWYCTLLFCQSNKNLTQEFLNRISSYFFFRSTKQIKYINQEFLGRNFMIFLVRSK
jgi:hypothetical protein